MLVYSRYCKSPEPFDLSSTTDSHQISSNSSCSYWTDYFAHLVVSKTTGIENGEEEIIVIQYQAVEIKIPLQF